MPVGIDMAQILTQFGLCGGLVVVFVWLSIKREERMELRNERQLEAFQTSLKEIEENHAQIAERLSADHKETIKETLNPLREGIQDLRNTIKLRVDQHERDRR